MTNDTHGLESQGLYRIPEAARLLGTTLTRTLRLTQEFKSVSPALATPESLAEPFGAN